MKISKRSSLSLMITLIASINASMCENDICIPGNYSRHTPYRPDPNIPMEVDMKFKINSVPIIDTGLNTVTIGMNLVQTWRDDRVKPDNEGWTHVSDQLKEHIWMPTLYIYNMTSLRVCTAFTEQQMLWVNKLDNLTTQIQFIVDFDLTVMCSMKYDKFPFDEHTCYVRITSLVNPSSKVSFTMDNQVNWTTSPNIVRDYDIKIVQLENNERELEDSGDIWSLSGFKLKLLRRYDKYIYTYYLTSTLFVIVSWVSFLIPPTVYPARVALLITILLVLVNIFNNVINHTPSEAEGLTALSIWVLVMITFVCCTFFSYVFVLINIGLGKKNRNISTNDVISNLLIFWTKKEERVLLDLMDLIFLFLFIISFCIFLLIYIVLVINNN